VGHNTKSGSESNSNGSAFPVIIRVCLMGIGWNVWDLGLRLGTPSQLAGTDHHATRHMHIWLCNV